MNKFFILFFTILTSMSSFSQSLEGEKIKYRKLNYNDFSALSINDTSMAVIDIFFDKKDNAALGQMSFLPITAAIFIISPTISIGLTAVSLPLFINGSYMLVKYRNKKLHLVLTEYKKTKTLPRWIRKKANKHLVYIEALKSTY